MTDSRVNQVKHETDFLVSEGVDSTSYHRNSLRCTSCLKMALKVENQDLTSRIFLFYWAMIIPETKIVESFKFT